MAGDLVEQLIPIALSVIDAAVITTTMISPNVSGA